MFALRACFLSSPACILHCWRHDFCPLALPIGSVGVAAGIVVCLHACFCVFELFILFVYVCFFCFFVCLRLPAGIYTAEHSVYHADAEEKNAVRWQLSMFLCVCSLSACLPVCLRLCLCLYICMRVCKPRLCVCAHVCCSVIRLLAHF